MPPVAQLRPGARIVICGAGPAGLTAAYLLAKRGYRPIVVESDDSVGGIAKTVLHNGFRFDIGGHRFFTKSDAVRRLWSEILGEPMLTVPRLSRIHYRGIFVDYPLKPLKTLTSLGVVEAGLMIGSYLLARFRRRGNEQNFEQWVTNRFGARLYRTFFKTYTEKVWGIPCTEIRAEWAAQRIAGLSLWEAIRSATALTKRSEAIATLIDSFEYPRLGPGQMWETCRDRIRELGGEVLPHHRVITVTTAHGRATGIRVATPTGIREIKADHVISSIPLRALSSALTPPPPRPVIESARALRYRDFITVALVLDREQIFPDTWLYIHTPGVRVGRIQNFNNWSAALVPEPGRTCLGMEYFCFEGDGLWSMPDAELIALATAELKQLGIASTVRVVDGSVVRMPKAYPIYDEDYRHNVAVVREHLDAIPNLHSIGRNGMHKYNNQDHSMLTAMLLVDNMHGASHDLWTVNTDYEYHESQSLRVPPPEALAVAQ